MYTKVKVLDVRLEVVGINKNGHYLHLLRYFNPAMNSIEDYVVFVLSLLIPIAVGFYFACRGGRQKTTTEFLLADKNLRSWLVSLSLVASYFSSVVLLGTTAEVFTYGVQYIILALFSYWLVAAAAHVVFIPMFHRVKVTSVNEVS